MESTAPPKPRWRPRFSLRTLMIGVLLISFVWTSTVVWGVPSVIEKIPIEYHWDQFEKANLPTMSARGIAPFLVKVDFIKHNQIVCTAQYIWLFGYSFNIYMSAYKPVTIEIPKELLDKAEPNSK